MPGAALVVNRRKWHGICPKNGRKKTSLLQVRHVRKPRYVSCKQCFYQMLSTCKVYIILKKTIEAPNKNHEKRRGWHQNRSAAQNSNKNCGTPNSWMVESSNSPLKWDDFGVALFQETSILWLLCRYTHMRIDIQIQTNPIYTKGGQIIFIFFSVLGPASLLFCFSAFCYSAFPCFSAYVILCLCFSTFLLLCFFASSSLLLCLRFSAFPCFSLLFPAFLLLLCCYSRFFLCFSYCR